MPPKSRKQKIQASNSQFVTGVITKAKTELEQQGWSSEKKQKCREALHLLDLNFTKFIGSVPPEEQLALSLVKTGTKIHLHPCCQLFTQLASNFSSGHLRLPQHLIYSKTDRLDLDYTQMDWIVEDRLLMRSFPKPGTGAYNDWLEFLKLFDTIPLHGNQNHIMRTWLENQATLKNQIPLEQKLPQKDLVQPTPPTLATIVESPMVSPMPMPDQNPDSLKLEDSPPYSTCEWIPIISIPVCSYPQEPDPNEEIPLPPYPLSFKPVIPSDQLIELTIDSKLDLLLGELSKKINFCKMNTHFKHPKDPELSVLIQFTEYCTTLKGKTVDAAKLDRIKHHVFHWINDDEEKPTAQSELPSLCQELSKHTNCTKLSMSLFSLTIIAGLSLCAGFGLLIGGAGLLALMCASWGITGSFVTGLTTLSTIATTAISTEALIAAGVGAGLLTGLCTWGMFKVAKPVLAIWQIVRNSFLKCKWLKTCIEFTIYLIWGK